MTMKTGFDKSINSLVDKKGIGLTITVGVIIILAFQLFLVQSGICNIPQVNPLPPMRTTSDPANPIKDLPTPPHQEQKSQVSQQENLIDNTGIEESVLIKVTHHPK